MSKRDGKKRRTRRRAPKPEVKRVSADELKAMIADARDRDPTFVTVRRGAR